MARYKCELMLNLCACILNSISSKLYSHRATILVHFVWTNTVNAHFFNNCHFFLNLYKAKCNGILRLQHPCYEETFYGCRKILVTKQKVCVAIYQLINYYNLPSLAVFFLQLWQIQYGSSLEAGFSMGIHLLLILNCALLSHLTQQNKQIISQTWLIQFPFVAIQTSIA